MGPAPETRTVDEVDAALPSRPLDVTVAEGPTVHYETKVGARARRAPGSRGYVLVGQGLGHGAECHLQAVSAAVSRAHARAVLHVRQGEHTPAVPAQHPGHGQGEPLCVQFREFLGRVVTEASTGQWTVTPDRGRGGDGEEHQRADGYTDAEDAVRHGEAGGDPAHGDDDRDEGGQHLAESWPVASLRAQRTDRTLPL